MKEADTLQAIAAADNALPAWRAKTAGERADLLYAWYNLMMEHQDDLGALMTLEQGKPLAESRAKSPTPRPLSSGSPRKPAAPTATPSPVPSPASTLS